MRTERGLDRFVTFLDAVVAIAITLLVLPLTELPDGVEAAGLETLLVEEAVQIAAFFLSFAVIARMWLVHHRLVETVGSYDRAFLQVNLAWILTVVLLPFTSQLVAGYGTDRLAVGLYIGNIALSSCCLTAISLLVWRRPALRRGADQAAAAPWSALATTGLLVVALLVGTLVSAVNYWALVLLFLSGPIETALRRRVTA